MNKSLASLLIYFGIVLVALVIQTTFWPRTLQDQGLLPHIIIPLLIYFFSYSSFVVSLYLIYGVALFAMSLSSYTFLQLFTAFLLMSFYVSINKSNYEWMQLKFFLTSCFIWSLLLPLILKLNLFFSYNTHTSYSFLNSLLSAFITTAVSYALLPLLQLFKTHYKDEYL